VLLTVDVEDWFQVENFKPWIPHDSWSRQESRVEANTLFILDLLDRCGKTLTGTLQDGSSKPVQCTFFILGWTAAAYPALVREIVDRGHEIASHGYSHQLAMTQSASEFRRDIARSKRLLEDLSGNVVVGYRAPSFSITETALDIIAESGFTYDSSYNSFEMNPRYGRLRLPPQIKSGRAGKLKNGLIEVPISNLNVANRVLPWGGGGYFRLIPTAVFRMGVKKILHRHRAFIFYTHPWEFDPSQPIVKSAGPFRRFRHYFNLTRTAARLEAFIAAFSTCQFTSIREYISAAPIPQSALAN
jgi:polysaccharide deacetylase family protein (PEP-CTERM system associated)